jgi:hypothetical protein
MPSRTSECRSRQRDHCLSLFARHTGKTVEKLPQRISTAEIIKQILERHARAREARRARSFAAGLSK